MFIEQMTSVPPKVFKPSAREKGKYGDPHLVMMKPGGDHVSFRILVPYREGKDWLSWVDEHGNVYLPIDNELPVKWIKLSEVDKETLGLLGLKTDQDWSKALS